MTFDAARPRTTFKSRGIVFHSRYVQMHVHIRGRSNQALRTAPEAPRRRRSEGRPEFLGFSRGRIALDSLLISSCGKSGCMFGA